MKRKILLVENLLLSPLPLIILIHLLFLYHYYPPTNDRVEAIVPLNALLCQKTKHNKKPICNSFLVSCLGYCVALFSPLPGVTHSREAG